MRTTTIVTARPLGRRLATAAAAVGLAASLTACTIGTGDDGKGTGSGTASSAESAAPSSGAPGDAGGAAGAGTPDTPIEDLILSAQDAPELNLQAVPADQISEGLKAMGGITEGARVEPPECADFNQATLDAQAAPGTTAIRTGQSGSSPVAVAVSTVADGVRSQRASVERCPDMTVTLPLQGTEVRMKTTNTLLPHEAPEGVEDFVALSQKSSMDLGGFTQGSTNVVINGVVRGVAVTVSATGPEGGVPDSARDAALRAFTTQVEKIRNA